MSEQLQLRHGYFDPRQTDEINRIVKELVGVIIAKTASLSSTQQSSQQSNQQQQLVNALATPLIGGQSNSNLATVGQSGATVTNSQIVSMEASKITTIGARLSVSQQSGTTLYGDLTSPTAGAVPVSGYLTVSDGLGNSIKLLYTV